MWDYSFLFLRLLDFVGFIRLYAWVHMSLSRIFHTTQFVHMELIDLIHVMSIVDLVERMNKTRMIYVIYSMNSIV